jgi:glycosyltransferase involved in cell wall biosynthesis
MQTDSKAGLNGRDNGELPWVSIILPTLNSARTLDECLASIRAQDYPRDRVEIVVADAGSTDATLDIARRHGVERIVDNPLRTGEAGKAAAIAVAQGSLLALIDSDNILPTQDWLRRMVAPFDDPAIFASEPLEYTRRAGDPALTRYFAMLGMNDPLCLFIGNYDRMCAVTGHWTGLDVPVEDRGGYLRARLSPEALPTVGANGCIVRREVLSRVTWSPYYFDIDVIQQAVGAGLTDIAKVKCGIVHLFAARLADFGRKQDRRIRDFLHYSGEQQRTYPWRRQRLGGVARFCVATVLVVPLLWQMARGARRCPDSAWRYHVPVCWATLWRYGVAVVRKALGGRVGPAPRAGWQR